MGTACSKDQKDRYNEGSKSLSKQSIKKKKQGGKPETKMDLSFQTPMLEKRESITELNQQKHEIAQQIEIDKVTQAIDAQFENDLDEQQQNYEKENSFKIIDQIIRSKINSSRYEKFSKESLSLEEACLFLDEPWIKEGKLQEQYFIQIQEYNYSNDPIYQNFVYKSEEIFIQLEKNEPVYKKLEYQSQELSTYIENEEDIKQENEQKKILQIEIDLNEVQKSKTTIKNQKNEIKANKSFEALSVDLFQPFNISSEQKLRNNTILNKEKIEDQDDISTKSAIVTNDNQRISNLQFEDLSYKSSNPTMSQSSSQLTLNSLRQQAREKLEKINPQTGKVELFIQKKQRASNNSIKLTKNQKQVLKTPEKKVKYDLWDCN